MRAPSKASVVLPTHAPKTSPVLPCQAFIKLMPRLGPLQIMPTTAANSGRLIFNTSLAAALGSASQPNDALSPFGLTTPITYELVGNKQNKHTIV